MNIKFNKFQGTGNDFIIADNRQGELLLTSENIRMLCDRRFGIGADGMILIESSKNTSFYMRYYNADGKESTMCGNGGRCAAHYALKHGIASTNEISFTAADGVHHASVRESIVELTLQEPDSIRITGNRCFLNTGSPHLVVFVDDPAATDLQQEGASIRYSEEFAPEGTNVNFATRIGNTLVVRTYERGIEAETLSCGTGVTASAIAAVLCGHFDSKPLNSIEVATAGGTLKVTFTIKDNKPTEVKLTGEATFVFSGTVAPGIGKR